MPKRSPPRGTVARKAQHVDLVLKRNVTFRSKTTGLEEWEFVHNALPELDLAQVDCSTVFLGHALSAPLMVSCMTGGYAGAGRINRDLAAVCAEARIAMGVGSQRQALEDTTFHKTFSVVRDVAPGIPIVGNIGAAEIASAHRTDAILRLLNLVKGDALAVHLNPLQEFLQPEGTPQFSGVLEGIALLVRELPVPVIVKEVGAGLSRDVVRRLLDAGVRYIDVAGAGGTSWAGVEILRRDASDRRETFWDWGVPTATAVREAASLRTGSLRFTLIASGGIGSGMDMARCIALGADLVGSARPMLEALRAGGRARLLQQIQRWMEDLRGVMFLTGARTIADLQTRPLVRRSNP
ncbi:MAG: type 2 isopentenyl-diphosphate Delta-isomerase [Bacteroidetes bacterium]|nr:type 2 isopentenyl-diphosphate Delta-isomerase [Bacteroidota bacterium]